MDHSVHVGLGDRSYDILIGQSFESVLRLNGVGRKALLVGDSNTGPRYHALVRAVLEDCGFGCDAVVVPAGEATKSLEQVAALYEQAMEAGLDRRGLVVAVGGGVVGDLAGFVAASYLRGVDYLQVPTSLLAMVDSSVGGKTGVNLRRGKNLVGAFHQPVQVAVNLATLDSLPIREYRSGLAEVVKYGVIADADFFDALDEQVAGVVARSEAVLPFVVKRCCELKAAVVGEDEREGGRRAILNYGHTLAHALETVAGYGHWLHGEAVSIGMVYAGLVSVECSGFPLESAQRVERLLAACGLPTRPDDLPSWESVREVMASDKKAKGGVPTFVLASALGSVSHGVEVPEGVLASAYQQLRNAQGSSTGAPYGGGQ